MEKTVALQQTARGAGIMVCYCATVFRPGYPEIGGRNKTFGQRKASGQAAVFDPLAVIHPAVAPAEGEVVVGASTGVNALYGTGAGRGIAGPTTYMTWSYWGMPTSGVVLSTVRYASDLDYNLFVVEGLLLGLGRRGTRVPDGAHLPATGRGGAVGGCDSGAGGLMGEERSHPNPPPGGRGNVCAAAPLANPHPAYRVCGVGYRHRPRHLRHLARPRVSCLSYFAVTR